MPLFSLFNRNQAYQNQNNANQNGNSTGSRNSSGSRTSSENTYPNGYRTFPSQPGRMGMGQNMMNQNSMNQRTQGGGAYGNNQAGNRNGQPQQGRQGGQGPQGTQGGKAPSRLSFGMALPDGIRLEPYDPNKYQIPSAVQPAPLPQNLPQATQDPAMQSPNQQALPQMTPSGQNPVQQGGGMLSLPQMPQMPQGTQVPPMAQTPLPMQVPQIPQTPQTPQAPQMPSNQNQGSPQHSSQTPPSPTLLQPDAATVLQPPQERPRSRSQQHKLGLCIQNERNAKLFYDQLFRHTPQGKQGMLREIMNDSAECRALCEEIFSALNGHGFQASNEQVSIISNYGSGIGLAIQEESRALKDLAMAGSEIFDSRYEKKLNYLINKKQANLSLLVYQLSTKEVQHETTAKEG